jgi:hypothetical protein
MKLNITSNIYKWFFQLSLYESKTARINSLVHEHGISEDKTTQLIERDEVKKMLMDSIQERPFI